MTLMISSLVFLKCIIIKFKLKTKKICQWGQKNKLSKGKEGIGINLNSLT